jgi:hypothetical protein
MCEACGTNEKEQICIQGCGGGDIIKLGMKEIGSENMDLIKWFRIEVSRGLLLKR